MQNLRKCFIIWMQIFLVFDFHKIITGFINSKIILQSFCDFEHKTSCFITIETKEKKESPGQVRFIEKTFKTG